MSSNREGFQLGSVHFDITAAKEIVEGRESEEVETSRLTPVLHFLGCWPDEARKLPDEALDIPIIIATLDKGKVCVIDGLHRIWAADDRGRPTLRTVTLTREESLAIQSGPFTL